MRGVKRRMILTILALLILIPIIYIGDHNLLRFQLHDAVEKFAEDYCKEEVRVTGVQVRLAPNFSGQRRWSARTSPEIIGIEGVYYQRTIWLSKPMGCEIPLEKRFILDRSQREFIETDQERPRSGGWL